MREASEKVKFPSGQSCNLPALLVMYRVVGNHVITSLNVLSRCCTRTPVAFPSVGLWVLYARVWWREGG